MKKMFREVICTKSGIYNGKSFLKGEIYPVCGCNNGVQIVFENSQDDAEVMIFFNIGWDIMHPEEEEQYPIFRPHYNSIIEKIKALYMEKREERIEKTRQKNIEKIHIDWSNRSKDSLPYKCWQKYVSDFK